MFDLIMNLLNTFVNLKIRRPKWGSIKLYNLCYLFTSKHGNGSVYRNSL